MVGPAPLLTLPHLADDMARVEQALRISVEAADPFLTEVASHLIGAGGKRLRPALALTVGSLGGGPVSDDVVMGAVAVELVHLGSLYHDDVMDDARTRRNVESVNARWGNLVAILAGDFLLARASEIAASLGTEVAALLAATIGRLCEGQVRELSYTFDVGRTEDAYLTAIAGKTAALMATACRIGAVTSGAPRPVVEAVTVYGERIGMVFQIVDDVLDVVATDEDLGKPAGNDVAQGIYTLPVIAALSTGDADGLRRFLGRPLAAPELDEVRQLIRSNGAVATAIGVARRYADDANQALDSVLRELAGTGGTGGTGATGGGSDAVIEALRALGPHLIGRIPVTA